MRRYIWVAAALLVLDVPACGRRPLAINSLWDAVIVGAGGIQIPFRFEIVTADADAQGFFFEGDRKIGSTPGRRANDTFTFEYEFLNTTLQLGRKATSSSACTATARVDAPRRCACAAS